ncbi:MAG: tetratricopeptide repeat protein [Chloroflexia bacterium]|nr:tetratricopeptide repeat protein [Chloroflexia bacterium]
MSIERFADQLRRHRQAAGMTQETLAERSGLSVRGISDLERGVKRRPHPDTIRMLAAALDLAPETLASFRESATPRSPLAPAALPVPLTALIDREDEAPAIAALLDPGAGVRLVTLTGPGGVGKTRLAIQAAMDLRDGFADGVAFVALAGLTDPLLVLGAMANALGIRETPGRPPLDTLTKALQDRQALVVMDNFEHLLAAAPDVASLLAACPGLSVLATSRSPLHVGGEHEYPVRTLALPDPVHRHSPAELTGVPAVGLFVRQAQAVQPLFVVNEANAAAVSAICARVDGLPLALELAAVRMKTLAPRELESLLGNRLGVLTGGRQDRPARHRTMRSTIGWSHDLMPGDEQATFRRFAVFATGATLESTAAVIFDGDILAALDHLTALLDQSLVQRYEGTDGQPRFAMLETIREFALHQLAASEDESLARARHAAHFLDLAEQGETGLTGPDQAAWMARLETESGNLRAALGWSIQRGDAQGSQRFGSALWRFWSASGRLNEGRDWLDRALVLNPGDQSAVRAQALLRRGNIAVDLADYPSARGLYHQSLDIFQTLGDDVNVGRALGSLGLVYANQGEYAAARAAYESVLEVCQEHGWRPGEALALLNLGSVAVAEGDYTGARSVYDASLTIRRALGDAGGVAWASYWRGRLDRLDGRTGAANAWLTRAQAGFREVGDQLGIAYAMNELGYLASDDGNDRAALAYHLDALREREEAGAIQETVDSLEGIAAVAIVQLQVELGVKLFAAASEWRKTHGAPLLPALRSTYEGRIAQARSKLPSATFVRAWNEGETATLDEAIALAFTMTQ